MFYSLSVPALKALAGCKNGPACLSLDARQYDMYLNFMCWLIYILLYSTISQTAYSDQLLYGFFLFSVCTLSIPLTYSKQKLIAHALTNKLAKAILTIVRLILPSFYDYSQPAVAVTCIKRDPPLSGHFRVPPNDFKCKCTSIKRAPVQRGQRSAKFAPKR